MTSTKYIKTKTLFSCQKHDSKLRGRDAVSTAVHSTMSAKKARPFDRIYGRVFESYWVGGEGRLVHAYVNDQGGDFPGDGPIDLLSQVKDTHSSPSCSLSVSFGPGPTVS